MLSEDELKQFAVLLRAYRAGMPLTEFAEKLQVLFGDHREEMMKGMRTFVTPEQQTQYDVILKKCFNGESSGWLASRQRLSVSEPKKTTLAPLLLIRFAKGQGLCGFSVTAPQADGPWNSLCRELL